MNTTTTTRFDPKPWPGYDPDDDLASADPTIRRVDDILMAVIGFQGARERMDYLDGYREILEQLEAESSDGPLHAHMDFMIRVVDCVAETVGTHAVREFIDQFEITLRNQHGTTKE